jgi:hypothetical protein
MALNSYPIMMKSQITLLVIYYIVSFTNCFAQSTNDSIIPIIRSGYGYVNDELTIDGDFLWSEAGIELENNYIFLFNFKFGETINDAGDFTYFGVEKAELIYTLKIGSLFLGYDFRSKDLRHSFMPELGPFYSVQNIQKIGFDSSNNSVILKDSFRDVGIALELSYAYHFKSKISFGINASAYLAYQMGPLYYTISPSISIWLD